MAQITSSTPGKRVRKAPEERRAEILDAAARLALDEGIERVTMKQVATELGVRPGLISHYFASIDALHCEAFEHAVTAEREALFEAPQGAPALDRLREFLGRVAGERFAELGRLWINGRHLARYRGELRRVVDEQEARMRAGLTELITAGQHAGEFTAADPERVCLVLLVVIDGLHASANSDTRVEHPVLDGLVQSVAERELGLAPGTLKPR
ncbi:TetR/AcrR family transcriptional regulator [Nocardiopsis metallicus]|uniref:AcrR family transcriptional regulator n=1 Tax=Nocardiopsis metallicus TaxID=179819 RepID=A0A840VZW5_9ACTN|nr:TetR family transcriptional regulator [Nocardiopsis metallicus]MBB5490019.1 AcrR family transcriptional regulator [Nocardiopsis metallicus]